MSIQDKLFIFKKCNTTYVYFLGNYYIYCSYFLGESKRKKKNKS